MVDHLPGKGVGTDHAFVVCREKRKQWIKAYTGRDMRECLSIQGIQISIRVPNLLVCIKLEGTCFQVFTKKCSFDYNTIIQSRLFIEKHEYINVNSKTYIVYTLKQTRNKNETESGTKNQTFKGPTQDTICII